MGEKYLVVDISHYNTFSINELANRTTRWSYFVSNTDTKKDRPAPY